MILRTLLLLVSFLCLAGFEISAQAPTSRHRRAIVNGNAVRDPSGTQFFARSGRDSNKLTPDYLCGAILVHTDILLTAAHCQGSFNYGVLLYDPATNKYTKKAVIDMQIRYPDFNGKDMHNDVLVMRLETNPGLPIAKINSFSSIPSNDKQILTAYGFGRTTSDGAPSEELMEGYFEYVDNEECFDRVRSTSNSVVWDDVLCADPYMSTGSSICQGDSGGPLFDQSGVVVGIVSWNFRCNPDRLPDGFARLSFFYDWIHEQICFHSRYPLALKNTCPHGTSPPAPPLTAVQILLAFDHDYYPEETFFRILSKDREDVAYAGPQYVPSRESAWTSSIFLLPGEYTLEILDWAGNGLSPGASGSNKKGSWTLTAVYKEHDIVELASGGANFLDIKLIDFTVETIEVESLLGSHNIGFEEPSAECKAKKRSEESSLGFSLGIFCDCIQNTTSRWTLSCFDTKRNIQCVPDHEKCDSTVSLICCGDRRCSNGRCRTVSQGTEDRRIPLLAAGDKGLLGTIRGAKILP